MRWQFIRGRWGRRQSLWFGIPFHNSKTRRAEWHELHQIL